MTLAVLLGLALVALQGARALRGPAHRRAAYLRGLALATLVTVGLILTTPVA